MRTVAVYVRTSLTTQNLERQIYECKQYVKNRELGAVTLYKDQASGRGTDKRPQFQAMMKECRMGKHSHVVCLRIDRFSRSTKDLLNSISELEESGTKFVSVGNDIDTSSSTGKLILTTLAAVAAFEADLTRERVLSGMQAAKRKGVHCGRPRQDADRAKAQALLAKGMSQRAIAVKLGVSKGFVSAAALATKQKAI